MCHGGRDKRLYTLPVTMVTQGNSIATHIYPEGEKSE